jgi:hypothetical protein
MKFEIRIKLSLTYIHIRSRLAVYTTYYLCTYMIICLCVGIVDGAQEEILDSFSDFV